MLPLLPFAVFVADCSENLAVTALLLAYPGRLLLLARLAGLFTFLKWTLVGLSALVVIFSFLGWLLHRRHQPGTAPVK